MKMFRTFLIIPTLLWFCAACVQVASPLPPTAKADPRAAILYGRFELSHEYTYGYNLALWLQNLDTKQNVYLYFNHDQPVYAAEVKPGRYRVAGLVCLSYGHTRINRKLPTDGLIGQISTSFHVLPESQVYLGDYQGYFTFDGTMYHWGVNSLVNHFNGTTVEYREKYPNLVTTPVVSAFNLF